MNITPDDAREALGAIEQVRAKTRAMLGFNGYFLLIWGCFWLAGGLISEFVGAGRLPWVWIPLYIASLLLSAKLGIDQGMRLRRESSIRIGVFCWLLLLYALLWYIVLQPLATLQGACLLITITFWLRCNWNVGMVAENDDLRAGRDGAGACGLLSLAYFFLAVDSAGVWYSAPGGWILPVAVEEEIVADLNELIHQPIRLRIMAMLVTLDSDTQVGFTSQENVLRMRAVYGLFSL